MNFLIVFISLSIINVIFSTIRSITTIKSGKTVASVISGGYFAFYNIMLLYTVADFPMWQKCVITFVCNVVGVYIVKLIEEKMRKDRLWKIEATFRTAFINEIVAILEKSDVKYNYFTVGKHVVFNMYCETQKQSITAKRIITEFNGKYFISESKNF